MTADMKCVRIFMIKQERCIPTVSKDATSGDAEGSEWKTLKNTPDETLARIHQLSLEFHVVNKNLLQKILLIHRLDPFINLIL